MTILVTILVSKDPRTPEASGGPCYRTCEGRLAAVRWSGQCFIQSVFPPSQINHSTFFDTRVQNDLHRSTLHHIRITWLKFVSKLYNTTTKQLNMKCQNSWNMQNKKVISKWRNCSQSIVQSKIMFSLSISQGLLGKSYESIIRMWRLKVKHNQCKFPS